MYIHTRVHTYIHICIGLLIITHLHTCIQTYIHAKKCLKKLAERRHIVPGQQAQHKKVFLPSGGANNYILTYKYIYTDMHTNAFASNLLHVILI